MGVLCLSAFSKTKKGQLWNHRNGVDSAGPDQNQLISTMAAAGVH